MYDAEKVFNYIRSSVLNTGAPTRVISCILIAEKGADEEGVSVWMRREQTTSGIASAFGFVYQDMSVLYVDVCGNIWFKETEKSQIKQGFNIYKKA